MQDVLGPTILWYMPPDEPTFELVCSTDGAYLGDTEMPNGKMRCVKDAVFMTCPECEKFFSKPVDDIEDWKADADYMFDDAGNYVATRVSEVSYNDYYGYEQDPEQAPLDKQHDL